MERALENLDAAQRTAINEALEIVKHDTRIEAREQAKLDFRAGVAGSRKPDIFNPPSDTIQSFMENFEPFREVMCLNGRAAINSFMTYLKGTEKATIVENDIARLDDWDEFKEAVIRILSPPKAAVQARFELKKATQKFDEPLDKFGQRIINLAKIGYSPAEERERNAALRDTLIGGVVKDEIAIQLLNGADNKDFTELLRLGVELDASYRARKSLREGESVVSVMKTELQSFPPGAIRFEDTEVSRANYMALPRPPQTSRVSVICHMCHQDGHIAIHCPQSQRTPSVRCFNCSQPGHTAPQCPHRQSYQFGGYQGNSVPRPRAFSYGGRPRFFTCHWCAKPGHIATECRLRLRAQNSGQGYTPRYPNNQSTAHYQDAGYPGRSGGTGSGVGSMFGDRAHDAYNVALQRQQSRNIHSGPNEGLGFQGYVDRCAPENPQYSNPGTSAGTAESSTANRTHNEQTKNL